MVNKITFSSRCYDGLRNKTVFQVPFNGEDIAINLPVEEARKIEAIIGHLRRNRKAYTMACYGLAVILMPNTAYAAATGSGGMNLLVLMQKASFWVGLAMATWGIIEAQMDFPGWKGRIIRAVLGYVGILLLPLVFLELQNSLQVNVWDQINKESEIDKAVNGGR